MALPIVPVNKFDLLRVAYVGFNVGTGTAVVNVQYYKPADPGSYANGAYDLPSAAAGFKAAWNAGPVAALGDQYRGKSVEVTVYKTPWRTELDPGPPPITKRKMLPYATYVEDNNGVVGGRSGAALPDYVVYRPIKYTGRAGRSWRGNMAFSPLLEADTNASGNTWTGAFLIGNGLTLRGFMMVSLSTGDPTKELMPVLFRISEYLRAPRVNPLTALDPTVAEWTPAFEARNANDLCGILRSRRARVGT